MNNRSAPVTVAVTRKVRKGREKDFGTWVQDITREAERFPGHLGSGYIRPADPDGEHTIVYRFDTTEHFDGWQNSRERARWVETSRELLEGEPRVDAVTGLEYWFHDPSCPSQPAPSRWKQAVLTEVGLYPTVLFVAYTVGLLVAPWPLPVRSLITTASSVILMTWIVMPLVSRLFRRWISPVT